MGGGEEEEVPSAHDRKRMSHDKIRMQELALRVPSRPQKPAASFQGTAIAAPLAALSSPYQLLQPSTVPTCAIVLVATQPVENLAWAAASITLPCT